MAWFRVQVTEDNNASSTRSGSLVPNLRFVKRCGSYSFYCVVGLTRKWPRSSAPDVPPYNDTWPRFVTAAWTACGGGTSIARKTNGRLSD